MVELKKKDDTDDTLNVQNDPEILSQFTERKQSFGWLLLASQEFVVLYSGLVQKQGFFSKDDRALVITNLCFYIFKKKSRFLAYDDNRDAPSDTNQEHLWLDKATVQERWRAPRICCSRD